MAGVERDSNVAHLPFERWCVSQQDSARLSKTHGIQAALGSLAPIPWDGVPPSLSSSWFRTPRERHMHQKPCMESRSPMAAPHHDFSGPKMKDGFTKTPLMMEKHVVRNTHFSTCSPFSGLFDQLSNVDSKPTNINF